MQTTCYAEVETPGKTIYVDCLSDPFEYRPSEFDPHGVGHDLNTCKTCARDIRVTAHLMSGFCAQVCRQLFAEALELYTEANAVENCEMCQDLIFVRDSGSTGTGWSDDRPDEPYVLCIHCHDSIERG